MKRILLALFAAFGFIGASLFAQEAPARKIVLPEGITAESFPEGMTVYDGTEYHAGLEVAIKAIHDKRDRRTLWCKPEADVGKMNAHQHVCLDLTVYGNGATVAGDIELDTYWKRADGTASGGVATVCPGYADDPEDTTGVGLKNAVTLKVYALNGISVWGQRSSDFPVDITLEDCENVGQVMQRGDDKTTETQTNITLRRCTFTGKPGTDVGTVHSVYPGAIVVEGCTFEGVACPINLNNKSQGTQTVTVKDCVFRDCATTANATGAFLTYAAPIRVVAGHSRASVNLTVDGCSFTYTEGTEKANGDILLGDGRTNGEQGKTVSLSIVNTEAEVQAQQVGDRTETKAEPTMVVHVAKSAAPVTYTNNFTWDGKAIDLSWYEAHPAAKAYTIGNPAQLAGLAQLVNEGATFSGKTITLAADIDLANKEWRPIGTANAPFQGAFEGNGKAIKNLKIANGASSVGLFGHMATPAKIQSLTVSNASVKGVQDVGALVGAAFTGTVENCHVKGTIAIEGNYKVGGLAGGGYADITACSVKGAVSKPATITATHGKTDLEGDNVGGLIGFRGEGKGVETIGCTVENATVSGSRKVGGLIGSAFQNNVISGCKVAHVTVACNAPTDYANNFLNKPTNGFGGLVGLYTANGGNNGTLADCAVSDIAFTAADDVKGALSMGYVTGGLRGGYLSGKPVAPADTLNASNNTVSGTNTGANTDFLFNPVAQVGDVFYPTLAAAVAAVPPGAEEPVRIRLLKDVDGSGVVVKAGQAVEIDLGGHTYTVTKPTVGSAGTETNGFQLLKGAVVSFKNGAIEASATSAAILFQNYATLTLEDVRVNAQKHPRLEATLSNNCGALTVKGGTEIYASEGGIAFDLWYWPANGYGEGVSAAFDKSFTGKVVGEVQYGQDGTAQEGWQEKVPLTVAEGVKGTFDITFKASSAGALENANISIAGGVFATAPDLGFCAPGYAPLKRPDGAFAVSGPYVALVNDTAAYATLAEAIAAANSGDTVTLLADIVMKTQDIATVPASVQMTLDMAKHRITVAPDFKGRPIVNEGTLVVTGEGVIDSSASEEGGYGAINNHGTLTIENGTYRGATYANGSSIRNTGASAALRIQNGTFDGATCAVFNEGTATIENGTFAGTTCSACNSKAWSYTIRNDAENAKMYIRGGTFTGVHGAVSSSVGHLEISDGSFKAVRCVNDPKHTATFYALYVAGEVGKAKCLVKGGTFETEGAHAAVLIGNDGDGGIKEEATCEIQGGTFRAPAGVPAVKGAEKTGNPRISGGTFSSRPASRWCAEGFVAAPNAAGAYEVVPGEWAVAVGEEKYATVQEAVDAAKAGETIVLQRDVTLEGTVALDKDIALDLAGHTLYAKDGETPAFAAAEGTESAKVSFSDSSKPEGGDKGTGAFIAKVPTADGKVTIEGAAPLAITKWTDEGAYDTAWYDSALESAGEGAVAFTIANAKEFAGLAVLGADAFMVGDTITLSADIDLSALEWVPPAYGFNAALDGAKHTVSGLWTKEATGGVGLFAYVTTDGVLENLRLAGAKIQAAPGKNPVGRGTALYAGAFAGVLNGTIRNCVATDCAVTVVRETKAQGMGGVAGQVSGGMIADVLVDVALSHGEGATAPSGAFAGAFAARGTLENCLSLKGEINATLAPSATLSNVYTKTAEGRFIRHATAEDGSLAPETLGEAAQLHGIGWLLNGQATDETTAWRADSNESATTLLPFATAKVATVPAVEPYVTVKTNSYFANGHAVTVEEVDGKTVIKAYREDYLTDEVTEVVPLADRPVLYGGSHNARVASTSVTMLGGALRTVYGAGHGGTLESGADTTSVTVLGGTVENAVYGGGVMYAKVGAATIVIGESGKPGPTCKFVTGGGANAGELGEDDTRVGTATVTMHSGTVANLYGGGQGYSYVGAATVNLRGGTVAFLAAGGSNGTTKDATLNISGGIVTETIGLINRGTMETAKVTLSGTPSLRGATLTLGALPNANPAQNGNFTGAASVTLKNQMTDATQLPTFTFGVNHDAMKEFTATSASPLNLPLKDYDGAAVETIPAGQTLTLNGQVALTVPSGKTLTVEGMVALESGAALVGENGSSSLVNKGKLEGIPEGITVWDANFKQWVAAVAMGANGTYYPSINAALSAPGGVRLLSRAVAEDAGETIVAGAKTGGDAYDVADVLDGAFTVNGNKLVYDYALGVSGLTVRKGEGEALEVVVTVALTEGGEPVARKLDGRTLTVTSNDTVVKTETTPTFTAEGVCIVTIPYEKLGEGTAKLKVSVSKPASAPTR